MLVEEVGCAGDWTGGVEPSCDSYRAPVVRVTARPKEARHSQTYHDSVVSSLFSLYLHQSILPTYWTLPQMLTTVRDGCQGPTFTTLHNYG